MWSFDVQYSNKLFDAFQLLYDAEGLKVRASDSSARDALSLAARNECAQMTVRKRGLPSPSRFRDLRRVVMDDNNTLLPVEDSQSDVELNIAAPSEGRATAGGFDARVGEGTLDSAAERVL